jgi:hypothetical protein
MSFLFWYKDEIKTHATRHRIKIDNEDQTRKLKAQLSFDVDADGSNVADQHESMQLFSTDSEMDTFFRENQMVLIRKSADNSGSSLNQLQASNNFDDLDFDQMVTTAAQR